MKTCNKCGEEKDDNEFPSMYDKRKDKTYIRRSCIKCYKKHKNEHDREYHMLNRDKLKLDHKKYYQINKSIFTEKGLIYRTENRDKIRIQKKEKYHENIEVAREKNKKFYERKKLTEKYKESCKKYTIQNKEKLNEYKKKYAEKPLSKLKKAERGRDYMNNGGLEKTKKREQRIRDTIHDQYIIRILKYVHNIDKSAITQELIESYREQIKFKRLIKQLKNGNKQESTEAG